MADSGEEQGESRSTRREFLKNAATAGGWAAAGFALGRRTAPESTPSAEPEVPKQPSFRILRETDLEGDRFLLNDSFDISVNLATITDKERFHTSRERVEEPDLTKNVNLYRIDTPEGPVFQLELGLPILQRIPLSELHFFMSDNRLLLDSPTSIFTARDVADMLNAQNTINPRGETDWKISLFFHKFNPKLGVIVDEKDNFFSNAMPITEGFSDVTKENFTVDVEVDHKENPRFQGAMVGTSLQGWAARADLVNALEIKIIPKVDKPRVTPTPLPPRLNPTEIRSV